MPAIVKEEEDPIRLF